MKEKIKVYRGKKVFSKEVTKIIRKKRVLDSSKRNYWKKKTAKRTKIQIQKNYLLRIVVTTVLYVCMYAQYRIGI